MKQTKRVALTLDQINERVTERIKVIREILGDDFPMLDWYLGKYENYYRKIQMIEALNASADKIVYLINISDIINIALVAPIDSNIDDEARSYPDLFEKDDIYGFVLYLINERGFEMMSNAYQFNAQAYVQAAAYTRQAKKAAAMTSGNVLPENEDEGFKSFIDSLNAEQIAKFADMMRKTEVLDMNEIEASLDEDEKQAIKNHNKNVLKSIEGLQNTITVVTPKKTSSGNSNNAQQYASDGYNISKNTEITVLLSGYPSNEMMHRYVGIGTRTKMENLSRDIQVALDTGVIDIPYCGTIPEEMKKTKSPVAKGKRGGLITWVFGPTLYSFSTIEEARRFASQFDHHYSETGYFLQ